MAILIADGFDFYNSSTDMAYVGSPWTSAGAVTGLYSGAINTPYNAGQSAYLASAGSNQTITFSNEPTLYISFNINPSTNPQVGTATNGFYFGLRDTTNNQIWLEWACDGNFYARTALGGGTVIAGPWAHGMAINSWCHWQCKVVIDPTAGSIELRKNNNSADDISFTGLNTRQGSANSYANNIIIWGGGGGMSAYLDDLFVNSASGAAPNNWPTQLRAIQLMPNADTAQKQMTPLSGTTNFSQINELHMDSDTSYVYSSTVGNFDLYTQPGLTVTPVSIPLVVVKQSMKKSDTGARTATTHILSGATAIDGATVNLATTYQWQNTNLATDPNTSAAWTLAGVNALQIGPKVVA